MNSINVIAPYKFRGLWVFDDDRKGIVREPFVSGADTIINRMVEEYRIEDPEQGFVMLFSDRPFSTSQVELIWSRHESGGDWYFCSQYGMEGWLCPALLKYFPSAPKVLYVCVK